MTLHDLLHTHATHSRPGVGEILLCRHRITGRLRIEVRGATRRYVGDATPAVVAQLTAATTAAELDHAIDKLDTGVREET